MLECSIKFMDKERFAKQILLECGALVYCPQNHHLSKTTEKRKVDLAVKMANQIYTICKQIKTVEELENFIKTTMSKHATGCEFCTNNQYNKEQ